MSPPGSRSVPIARALAAALWLFGPFAGYVAPAAETGGRELSIRARPQRVHANALISFAVTPEDRLPADAKVAWKASRGLFHFDDLREVRWRAPPVPGPARIDASVRGGGIDEALALDVEVVAPSTDGMVWIPPGSFLRGDVDGTRNPLEAKTLQNDNDEPCHETWLGGFWIDEHPVTNEEYASFLQAAWADRIVWPEKVAAMGDFEGDWVPFYYFEPYSRMVVDLYGSRNARRPHFSFLISWDGGSFRVRPGFERHPVVDVTWFGATAYANYHGKQLPTDAQWEKAGRGTDGRRYPWGNNAPTAYHCPQDEDLSLAPVGSYSPCGDSPYGVADVLSGGFDWTSDWFNPDYYRDYLAPAPFRDPRGTFWGRSHSIRGFPTDLRPNTGSYLSPAPLTQRYEWILDIMIGDSFGNRQSTFRTVVEEGALLGSASQGRCPEPVSTAEAAARAATLDSR